jgi:hypothetical protein
MLAAVIPPTLVGEGAFALDCSEPDVRPVRSLTVWSDRVVCGGAGRESDRSLLQVAIKGMLWLRRNARLTGPGQVFDQQLCRCV